MDLAQIRELLRVVAESGVAEVEIEEEGFRMVVRLSAPSVTFQPAAPYPMPSYPYPAPAYPPPAPAPYAPPPSPPAAVAPPPAAPPPPPALGANDIVIKAPIVGTFYRAPGPDAAAFVNVGDRVNAGDVLCIIEAMKLMNEIESEVAGTIKEILVQNSEPVDFEKPLFVIAKE